MAKRRRKRASTKRRAAPRRARRVRMRGARRSTIVVYRNPRRRSRRRRGRVGASRRRRVSRRRNPSFGGSILKRTFTAFAAGFVTSGLAAVLDTQLSSYPMGKRIAKLAACFGIAHFGRKHPSASAAAIGALAASEGYSMGMRLGGGMGAAATPKEAVKGMSEMAETYPEMGALLNGGVGALLNGVPNVDESVVDYESALSNRAGSLSYADDDDE